MKIHHLAVYKVKIFDNIYGVYIGNEHYHISLPYKQGNFVLWLPLEDYQLKDTVFLKEIPLDIAAGIADIVKYNMWLTKTNQCPIEEYKSIIED